MGANEQTDLNSLLGKRYSISQDQLPITEAGRRAETAENLRRHKVYSPVYKNKNWNPFVKIKKADRRSTEGEVRTERADEKSA